MQKIYITLLLVFVFIHSSNAQLKWTVKKPFEQKNFIENKGQFFIKDKLKPEEIFYAATIDGVTYYFTNTGYTIQHFTKQKNTEHEIEELKEKTAIKEKEGEKEEGEFKYKTISQFHQMQWQGTNPNVQIVAEDIVSNYYTYNDVNDKQGKTSIKAQAYKKLTYKNLYPFVDVVYEFPADTTGIKYSIYLHPGADVNQVKINYPNNKGIDIDQQGNIIIKSEFGSITDHQPITYQLNNKETIKSNFILNINTVSFFVDKTPTNQTIVIDPWTVNPNFPNTNRAYDVDYDALGNVYAYGGYNAFVLNKYSSTGALIWAYTANNISGGYYGDFAIDINSGSIYIVDGFNPSSGSRILKLNSAAHLMATFPGNPGLMEMWRISFDKCSKKAVIGGGGINSPTYQTCLLDTNLANFNMVQYVTTNNCCHDINSLALDNYGNCYQVTNASSRYDGLFNNQLVKLPLPNLLPITYNVPTNYFMREGYSIYYNKNPSVGNYSNAYNGISTSNINVYTYDSYVLKKWQGSNGAQLMYKRVNHPAYGDSSKIYWGGLTSDDCDNVFLGSNNIVNQYDPNLNLTNSFTMTDTIFDVKLGLNNNLYVCGVGFVSVMQVSSPACNTNLQSTQAVQNPGCIGSLGSATVTPTGGSPPYTISWNTTPTQTGNIATNLVPGTYLATIQDNSCVPKIKVDTISITVNVISAQISQTNVFCNGLSTGAATIAPINGTMPYTYQWQSGQSTSSVTGLAVGSYTVKVSDATACNVTDTFTITQPTAITTSLSATNIKCNGDTVDIKVNAIGGYVPYTYLWNTNATTNPLYGATAGIYTVTISDSAQCTKAASYTLTQPTPLTANISKSDCKDENSSYLKVNASGSTQPYFYNWSTNPIQTTDSIYNLSIGNYSVTVTDANLCTKTFTESIYLNFKSFETVNVFTPNGDTKNEVFFPFVYSNGSIDVLAASIDNYELYIYDRWGKKVFYTTQATNTWDGKEVNGSTCPDGVYYWIVSINSKCENLGNQTFKGFVHLDR